MSDHALLRPALAVGLLLAALPAQASTGYLYRGTATGETVTTAGTANQVTAALSASMRTLAGTGGASGLVLHYRDASNYYLFLHSFKSAALMIYARSGGSYTLLASSPAATVLGEQHAMRAEADGQGNLRLYWDNALAVSATDSRFTSGRIGLRVWNQTVDFDDVLAKGAQGEALFADDFDDGDAQGWSAGSGWSVVAEGGGTMPMPVPQLDTDFEGGNGNLDFVDTQSWTIGVSPQRKGTSPYAAWFYFRLDNLSSARPTTLQIGSSSWLQRPYYSYDDRTWQPLPGGGGSYTETFQQSRVWIAHSIPYLTRDLTRLLQDVQGTDAEVDVLATSEGGRPVQRITITDPNATGRKYGIWMIGRQHAWEASGSWVVDELTRWLLSSDRHAVDLRRKAVVQLVPIADIDNVVLGGSGKDQQPIDINRDWRAEPHWNVVRSAIAATDRLAANGSYDIFIDSHCPGSSTFLAVQPQTMVAARYWGDFLRFRRLLTGTANVGSMPYRGAYNEWGPSYHPLWYQMSFWHQFTSHPELQLSLTLENSAASASDYRSFAAGFGRALDLFLYERFGNATPTSAGTPDLDFSGIPVAGATATGIDATGLLPSSTTALALGAPRTPALPLAPLGGLPGSMLLVEPVLVVPGVADEAGTLHVPLPIPNAAGFVGLQASFQLFDLDPSLTQASLPLGHSSGLTIEVGA